MAKFYDRTLAVGCPMGDFHMCGLLGTVEEGYGEAETLLSRAGYSLSSSSTMDLAIRFFLEHGFYNIHEINIMLYDLDLPLLGA